MAMLRDVLPAGLLTSRMKEEVAGMAEYITLFRAPHFLQARVVSAASRFDLEMWQLMTSYQVAMIKYTNIAVNVIHPTSFLYNLVYDKLFCG